jgi:hypothetical protein
VKKEDLVSPLSDHPPIATRRGKAHAARVRAPAAGRSSPVSSGGDAAEPPEPQQQQRDVDSGLILLLTFTVAMLVMVGMATLAAVVDRMWILIPVMAVDLIVTVGVIASIAGLLNNGDGG